MNQYIGVIHKEAGSDFGVSFPDFPGVAEFNPAPFLVAMKAGAPILPFVIHGTGEAWPKGSYAIHAGVPVWLEPLPALRSEEFAGFDGAKALAEYARARIDAAYRRGARA